MSEQGWVIERDGAKGDLFYFSALDDDGGFLWCIDHLEAVRFAREIDAQKVAVGCGAVVRIAEHRWG